MGSRYSEKCNQINYLIKLYDEYEKSTTQEDRDIIQHKMLFFIRDIKLNEEFDY